MNYIGPSVVIKGTVTSGEDLTIAGRVEGDVLLDAGELMLAPGSAVVGDLLVPSVIVHGSFRGNVTAHVRIDVRPHASVGGSLAAPALVVAEGAELNCRVEMPAGGRPRKPAVAPKLPATV
jgi:cytoskeletal protein CcmA (bactofilin family)